MKPVRAMAALLLSAAALSATLPGTAAATLRERIGIGKTDAEKAEEARAARDEARRTASETLAQLYAAKPEARAVVENADGYAVFSNFGMKFLVTGTATGRGLAVDSAGTETFMRMAEVQAGLGFGVKKFRQVFVFETPEAYRQFIDQGFELSGQAQVAAKADERGRSRGGAVSVSPGVWVYQLTDKGVVAELTVKGTKYYRDKDLD